LIALPRVLGIAALFSTAYGNVGSSIYYALGVTALFALGLTPAVFLFTGILFAFTALTYAEGTSAIPEAGGSSSFARQGFNELVSFIAAWALLLGYIVTISISAFTVPNYLGVFLPLFRSYPWNAIGGIAVIAFWMVINIRGIKETAFINTLLAILDIITQVLLVILGVLLLFDVGVLSKNIIWGSVPTWGQAIYGVSFAMIAYTGIETVSNMAEEAAAPEKTIPRSITLVFLTVLIIFAGISFVALSAMPVYPIPEPVGGWEQITPVQREAILQQWTAKNPEVRAAREEWWLSLPREEQVALARQLPQQAWVTDLGLIYLENPVLGIVHRLPVGDTARLWLERYIGFLAAMILFVATNAGIIGVSRLTFSMGLHQQLPSVLSKIHRRFRTPYVAIAVFSVIAAILIIPGRITFLAEMYVFGAVLAFAMAHVSIIAMRIRRPDLPRPWMIPGNITIRGVKIPVTAVLGGLGTFITWAIIVYTRTAGRWLGLTWLAIGIIIYLLYRRSKGLPITQTVRREARF